MSLKALAIQYLERNGLRNDSGTIAEKAVPLASEKTQGGWNGISGVEQVETPVRSEPSPGPVSESLRDLPAVPSPTVPATSPTVENLDTRQAVRLVLTHCQRLCDAPGERHPGLQRPGGVYHIVRRLGFRARGPALLSGRNPRCQRIRREQAAA